ncbi:DUF3861 family protein [Thalassotalea sp. HSM 43]|uniref:DUF3861 domain-containing protein n=1 Tax=Thalassotalea sp. HSM 43 TaxID=2552945 RepID=UPI001081CBDE|nr:DUF3861 domain-containing protein [Thalassotalea sp. HSM 43]QBY04369.1 DUF3861 family protein [Thalassotalea sp. HSM 43]
MKGHLYQFTIEHVEDKKGNSVTSKPLSFTTRNHDDVFKIVESMQGKMDLDSRDATALAVGLKLFGEVMLKHPKQPLFKELRPQFAVFMKGLKSL